MAEESPIHQIIHTGSKRVIFIGDVHGCFEELMNLLTLCNSTQDDVVCLLGNLTDKGPSSIEVLNFVRTASNIYSVMGNHDLKVIKAYRSHINGSGLKKKYSFVQKMTQADYDWLFNLPYVISFPDQKAIAVHAGLVPGIPIDDQPLVHMVTMRNLSPQPDQTWLPLERPDAGVPWASVWEGPMHVYFGHDSKRGLQNWKFATGIDTGCCKGYHLTAIVLPGGESISVPSKSRAPPPHALPVTQATPVATIAEPNGNALSGNPKNVEILADQRSEPYKDQTTDCMKDCVRCIVM